MSAKTKNKPMYFSSLEVENIKCFEKRQILDLKKPDGRLAQWTLILGENGVGKTTLLKCLSWMVPVQAPDEGGKRSAKVSKPKTTVDIKPYMDDFDTEVPYDQLVRMGKNVRSRISATLANGVGLNEKPSNNQLVSIAMKFERSNGKLDVVEAEKHTIDHYNTPTIFAYSASRHIAFKNIDNPELKDPLSNLFSDSADLYDAEQVLSMLDNAAHRHGKNSLTRRLLEDVKQILVDLLPDVENKDSIVINSPINEDGSINSVVVEVKSSDGKVKLQDLSLGYQTMFAWIVDLALRMLWNSKENKEPLKEPAVVIVDEIDLHLHPIWQREIREKLTHHFPNTQFICTAHSPFMAQASEEENLCVVKRAQDQITIENEPLVVKGWRIGQIATSELFGLVTERGPSEERALQERRVLLDKEKLSKAERNRLNELDESLSKLPIANDADQKIINAISDAVGLLKEKGIINDQNK